jgi:hypothetical protein
MGLLQGALTYPGITTWLDDWLQTKSGKTWEDKSAWGSHQSTAEAVSVSAGEWQRDTKVAGTWYCLGSPGGIVTDNNMCNKTCVSGLLHVGDGMAAPRNNKTLTKLSSSVTHHTNIRTLFPAVACACTPQELATK